MPNNLRQIYFLLTLCFKVIFFSTTINTSSKSSLSLKTHHQKLKKLKLWNKNHLNWWNKFLEEICEKERNGCCMDLRRREQWKERNKERNKERITTVVQRLLNNEKTNLSCYCFSYSFIYIFIFFTLFFQLLLEVIFLHFTSIVLKII